MSERNPADDFAESHGLAVEEERPKLKRPPLYRVILVNDDFTPMEFVVEVLQTVFAIVLVAPVGLKPIAAKKASAISSGSALSSA